MDDSWSYISVDEWMCVGGQLTEWPWKVLSYKCNPAFTVSFFKFGVSFSLLFFSCLTFLSVFLRFSPLISSILFLITTFWHWLDMIYTSLYLKKTLEELNTRWLLINNLINCKMTLTPSSLAFICEYNQLATSESLWLGPIASEFHSSVETAPDSNMLSVFQPFCKPSWIYLRLIPCKRSYIIGCLQTASYQLLQYLSKQLVAQRLSLMDLCSVCSDWMLYQSTVVRKELSINATALKLLTGQFRFLLLPIVTSSG